MTEKKRVVIIILLIGLVWIGSLIAYFFMNKSSEQTKGKWIAKLYQNGELIEEIDLSNVTESYQKTIQCPQGGYNVVEVRFHSIGIVDADCPDRLCQKQGFCKNSVQPIVCLPHRFVIELEKYDQAEEELDAIS